MNEMFAYLTTRLPFLMALQGQGGLTPPAGNGGDPEADQFDDASAVDAPSQNNTQGTDQGAATPSLLGQNGFDPGTLGPLSPQPSAAALQTKGDLLMQLLQSGLQSGDPNQAPTGFAGMMPDSAGTQSAAQNGAATPDGGNRPNGGSKIPRQDADPDVPPPDLTTGSDPSQLSKLANPGSPQPPVLLPDKEAPCLNKIQNALNQQLSKAGGKRVQVQYLGPTDVRGSEGDLDENRPGWRNGAYNFNFFVPMDDAQMGSTFHSGRWDNGLHVPSTDRGDPVIGQWAKNNPDRLKAQKARQQAIAQGQPDPGEPQPPGPHWGAGTYNGQKGFFFTAHFDSGSPFSRWTIINPIGLIEHIGDVAGKGKNDHGC